MPTEGKEKPRSRQRENLLGKQGARELASGGEEVQAVRVGELAFIVERLSSIAHCPATRIPKVARRDVRTSA